MTSRRGGLGPVRVVPVHDRRTRRLWASLPHHVYRDDPAWTPPIMAMERSDARRAPGGSEMVRHLALDGDRPVGRIACAVHPGREPVHLAFYEALDDDAIADALFDTAAAYARDRGRTHLVGPRSHFVLGPPSGLQVGGFDHPAPLGAPHHPPYYRHQWEDVGRFRPATTMVDYRVDRASLAYPAWLDEAEAAARAVGYHSPTFRRFRDVARFTDQVVALVNTAMADLPDVLAFAPEDAPLLRSRLRTIVRPDLWRLVFLHDQLVGVVAVCPELSAGLRRARGRLWPLGWWWIRRERHHTDTLTAIVAAFLPEHQSNGAIAAAAAPLLRTALGDERWQHANLLMIDDTNVRSRRVVEGWLGGRPVSEYRVYEREVDPPVGA